MQHTCSTAAVVCKLLRTCRSPGRSPQSNTSFLPSILPLCVPCSDEDDDDVSTAGLYAVGGIGTWEAAVMSLAAKVYSTPAQLASAMLGSRQQEGSITKLLADWDLGDAGTSV